MPSKSTRKRVRSGATLPDADRATIAPEKVKDYLLHPDKGKAKGFAKLGIYRDDWRYLHDELLKGLPTAPLTHVDLKDPRRTAFTVEITIRGLNGKYATVRTGWCMDSRCSPWLSTGYVPGDASDTPPL